MKILGTENIARVFSIFHDGVITRCSQEGNQLRMEVEIQYLAMRINPGFNKFYLRLHDIRGLQFTTWPSRVNAMPEIIYDIEQIFMAELDILEGRCQGDQLEIDCNQPSPKFEYCGGVLRLTVSGAEVLDESGKHHSLESLGELCTEYWDEWEKKNKIGK